MIQTLLYMVRDAFNYTVLEEPPKNGKKVQVTVLLQVFLEMCYIIILFIAHEIFYAHNNLDLWINIIPFSSFCAVMHLLLPRHVCCPFISLIEIFHPSEVIAGYFINCVLYMLDQN